MTRPVVVIVTGLPGTGKSTLADALGRLLGAPSFSGDWLLGSLQPAHGVLADLRRNESLAMYESLLGGLVTRQCLLGQSAVVDAVVDDGTLGRWAAVAAAHDHGFLAVECVCSDRDLHRSRIEGRVRGIPGWHEVDWHHALRMEAELAALRTTRLVLDAVAPVAANLDRVLDAIDADRGQISA